MLAYFLRIRFELVNRLGYKTGIREAQVITTRYTGEQIIPIGQSRDTPLLIGIFFIRVPLDDRTLLASIAAIVDSQFGERTDNGVAAVTTRNQIPDLRLFMGFLFRNKYLTT